MRNLLLAGLLALAGPALGQAWQANPADKFCGLSTLADSSMIDDCDSPDTQNILTDNSGAEERPGNTRIAQILSGYAAAMVGEFIAPSGTRYLIAHASTTIYQSDLGGTPVALSTTAANTVVDFITAYGKVIFQDGSGNPWQWDGTSTSTVAGMPICKYMEFADERVYCANIPSASASRVAVSSFGSTSNFTVPANVAQIPDASNTFDFQKDDGEGITCFRATPWGKVVGKRHSMHILKGYDNSTYYKRLIDPKIGCIDDRGMQMVDGLLLWLSYDGIYAWSGTGPPLLLTREIEPIIRQIRQVNATAASWVIDTLGDWQSGASSNNGPTAAWSTALVPASIIPSSSTFIDTSSSDFAGGTLSNVTLDIPGSLRLAIATTTIPINSATWSGYVVGDSSFNINPAVGSHCAANCNGVNLQEPCYCLSSDIANTQGKNATLKIYDAATGATLYTRVLANGVCMNPPENLTTVTVSTSIKVSFELNNTSNGSVAAATMTVKTGLGNTLNWNCVAGAYFCTTHPTDTCHRAVYADITISSFVPSGTFTSRTFDTAFATPTFNYPAISMSSNALITIALKEAASADGSAWDAAVTLTPGNQPASKKRYWRYTLAYATPSGTTTARFDEFGTTIVIGTGTYNSAVRFVGTAITAWKAFNATESNTGNVRYRTRSSATTFAAAAATPVWTAQPNNTTIGAAVAAYYQFQVDSSSVAVSTESAQIYRVASNWVEGTDKPVASGFLDHRYFLCVQLSSTAANNDGCLIYQKNNKWTKWVGPAPYAMGLFNNQLVVGDASTNSYVWKIMQPNVYQDDGAAINAYWTSKNFTLQRPFQQKILHEIWVDAVYQSTGSLSIGYATDKSGSFTSKTYNLNAIVNVFAKRVPLAAGFVVGKYLQFKFANAVLDNYFKINSYLFLTEMKDRIPE